jgi:hypothetical protein
MKKVLHTLFYMICLALMLPLGQASLSAQTPTLGTYANTSVQAGKNITIAPSAAPTNTARIVAYTNTNFTGVLTVNPTTGVVRVTDAKQAGNFTVTVKAFSGGGLSATRTFLLTVTDPNCSQGLFTGTTLVAVGNGVECIAIGDFNNDGNQDFAAANYQETFVSIRLGNGSGGFTTVTDVSVGTQQRAIAIGDFNGDGNQDFATANSNANTVSIRLGNGSGGFTVMPNVAVGTNPRTIAIGDFNMDGKQDIVTANSGASSVSIRLGDGTGAFSGTTNLSTGSNHLPISVSIGDFNGDTRQDLAIVIGFTNTNDILIWMGDGMGGFIAMPSVVVNTNPTSVTIGDLDGDGDQDLAVVNRINSNVSIHLGDNTGNFGTATHFSVGDQPTSFAIADFDGDGDQDFATANNSANTVSIRLGNGSGNFTGSTNVTVGQIPVWVAIGDFNGDGIHDFATANYGAASVSIRLGGEAEINLQGNSVSIADGDNTPGLADHTDFGPVVISTPHARVFTIQNLGNSPLSISSITSTGANSAEFVVSGAPSTVAAAGSATFTVTYTPTAIGLRTATITVNTLDCNEAAYDFAVQGQGTTPAAPTLGTYANTTIQAGDNATITPGAAPTGTTRIQAYTHTNFTGVLHVDPVTGVLTVTNAKQAGTYTVTVKAFGAGGSAMTTFTLTVTDPNCSQGLFTSGPNVATGTMPHSIAIGDFNEDGNQDLAVGNNNSISIRLGDGLGGFTGTTNITTSSDVVSVAVGDFDGDGNQDLVASYRSTNSVTLHWGNGAGGFPTTSSVGVGLLPIGVAVGDFNGDGKQDFAASNSNLNNVSIRLGDGARNFTVMPSVTVGSFPRHVAVADFNDDGYQDLAVVNQNSANVSIHWGNGTGNFTAGPIVPVGSAPWSVAIGDFNEDGDQDFVTANWNVNSVSIRLGNGQGIFSTPSNIAAGTQPASVAIGDYNGDGHQDLAVANNTSNDVSILLGYGNGSFAAATTYTTGNGPNMIATGDFNGDRKHDLATANQSSSVSIRLGGEAEINLQGNAISIADGDATPSSTDHTDFGSVLACSGTLVRSFTIQNLGTVALSLSGATITGPQATDFVVTTLPDTTVAVGGSTTIQVTFDPSATGLRTAILNIQSADCNEGTYNIAIQGTGDADIVLPAISCPADVMVNNAPGLCTAVATFAAPLVTDNCAGASATQTVGLPSGAVFPVGTTTNTLVATDASGNTASCTFTVKVMDTEAPTMTCPASLSVSNSVGLCGAVVTYASPAVADNCTGASVSVASGLASGANFPGGTTACTLMATDASGTTATCSFTVTVTDAEAPAITCPVNSSVSAGVGACSAVVTFTAPATTDNCAGPSTVQTAGLPSGSTFQVGTTTNAYVATDASGNTATCAFTVTVLDTQAPTITCTSNISVSASLGACSAVVTYSAPSATDNCGAASISQIAGLTSGSAFPVGTTTNTFEAIDAHGQTSTCSFTVNVVDTEAPTITCPANIGVSNSVGLCGAVVVFSDPAVADNCSGASTVQTMGTISGATYPVGITTNTYVVTDGHGLTATCSFTVTVTDIEAPTMTCPANITMNIDSVHCEVPVTWAAPTVQDNCGAGTLSSNYSSGDLFARGTRTVTYTVTDQGGNTDTCTFTVTIHQPAFALYVAVYTHAGGANTSCHGVHDGEAGAYPSGGCLPYDYLWSTGQMNQSITGLAPGGYWVTVTDGQGNMAWDTVTIIEALPVATPFITFTQGGPVACQGDTIGLIGPSGAISYNWSNGGSTIGTQVTGSGMISLNIFDQFGCPGVDSVSMTFHPSPTPLISQSGNTLSSSAAVTYQWYRNGGLLPGATQQTHIATQSGTYTVVVTDANGCEGASNPLVVTIVGLDEVQFDPNLQVFPNPFGSAFTVELDLPEPLDVTATVYALHGAIVWQSRSAGEVQRYAQTIPTHEVAAGVYYLRIQAGDHLIVRKVVKQ